VSKECLGTDKPLTNAEPSEGGTYDLRSATVHSVNTVFTRLILDVGVDNAMAMARSMGLTSVRPYDPKVHCASVALGVESVSPLDMASAYGVFANHGERAEPTPVLRVVDRTGKVLIDNTKPMTKRIIAAGIADNVTAILQGVLQSGTAAGKSIDRPAAGKTGTTQNHRDAWFVGYTPTLSTSVWLGYVNRSEATARELRDIKGIRTIYGGTWPARIWQDYMRAALKDVPKTSFAEPAPIAAVPDAVVLRQRNGFAPGRRFYVQGAPPDDGYVEDPGTPVAPLPTSTTVPPPTTTTSEPDTTTTEPSGDGGFLN
jgi:penicillin-binding protein 1A